MLKNIFRRKVFWFLLISAVSTTLFVRVTFAQNQEPGLNLTLSPPVFDLVAEPGDTIKETFRIRNNNNSPLALKIQARRLVSDPNSGSPIPETEASGPELSWVSFEPSRFTAPANDWTNVNFTIDIPETAAYGYYYVFSITPQDDSEQGTTGTTIKGELLAVTLLTVKKEGTISKAELVRFAPKNFITEYLPAEFETEVANRGNVHVKPHGNVFITRGEGKDLAILDVNPGVGSVLPGGRRVFESSWNEGFIVREPVLEANVPKLDASGKPMTKLVINWNKLTEFRIGPYTARLLMIYDDGTRDQTIEGLTTFWVIPYTAIGVILVAAVVIFVLIRVVLRSYVRSQIKKGSR